MGNLVRPTATLQTLRLPPEVIFVQDANPDPERARSVIPSGMDPDMGPAHLHQFPANCPSTSGVAHSSRMRDTGTLLGFNVDGSSQPTTNCTQPQRHHGRLPLSLPGTEKDAVTSYTVHNM